MEDVDMLKDNMFKKSDLTNTLHSKHGVAIGDVCPQTRPTP